jgi:hypothetical protein
MANKYDNTARCPQALLEKELIALKTLLPFEAAQKLSVCWKPNLNAPVLGEIVDCTIFLYDSNIEAAVSTLKHEYLDFYLSKRLISPLISMLNLFIELKTKEVYLEKERVVDSLLKFIDLTRDTKQ